MEKKEISNPLGNAQRLLEYYKRLRKMQQINPTELERKTGVARPTIYKYEKGQSIPSIETMNRLLEPLGYKLGVVPLENTEDDLEEKGENRIEREKNGSSDCSIDDNSSDICRTRNFGSKRSQVVRSVHDS